MSTIDLHSTTDAMAWAKEFVKTLREYPETADPHDEGFMVGWFANAMMAQHDELMNGHLSNTA
jgi:hypothetical protein